MVFQPQKDPKRFLAISQKDPKRFEASPSHSVLGMPLEMILDPCTLLNVAGNVFLDAGGIISILLCNTSRPCSRRLPSLELWGYTRYRSEKKGHLGSIKKFWTIGFSLRYIPNSSEICIKWLTPMGIHLGNIIYF
jgi:hypothetical protein